MQRVAFHTVLRETAGLAGFTLAQLTNTPTAQFRTFINRQAREQWQHWWWTQLMRVELRDVTAATDGGAYIDLEQSGEEPIGTVRLLSVDHPLEEHEPRPTPYRLVGERIWLLGATVPADIYVWFREQAPTWLGDDYSATATYAAGRTVYYSGTGEDYEGDFWESLSATTAGQNPENTPAKWSRIEFPAWLRSSVAQAAYADYLRQDGNPDAAALADREAMQFLSKAIHRDSTAQRQLLRVAGA